MGSYIYCVVPAGHAPEAGLHGFGGQVTERIVNQLGVWTSETERPEAGAEQAQVHNRIVEAAATDQVTPVPLRFGQWSEDFAVFEKAIESKATWYEDRLRAFRGALEFGIRILDPAKETAAQHVRDTETFTGLEYMKALQVRAAAAQAKREDVQLVEAAIDQVLGTFVREQKTQQPRTPHGLIDVVQLVAREHFDSYREGAQTLRARFPDFRFLVSGPWVPYSFAQ